VGVGIVRTHPSQKGAKEWGTLKYGMAGGGWIVIGGEPLKVAATFSGAGRCLGIFIAVEVERSRPRCAGGFGFMFPGVARGVCGG